MQDSIGWRIEEQTEICSTPHLHVVHEVFQLLPGDGPFPWLTVKRKASVVILAETTAGKLVMIRQFRPSIRQFVWELPAGQIDGDVTASAIEQTVRIELQEETGYELISPLQFLGRFFSSPGFTNEQQLVFRAKTKKGSHTPGDDAHRICSIEEMEIKKIKRMIANGEITDAKTLAAFTLLSANAQK